jgi:GINS complex subunit 1
MYGDDALQLVLESRRSALTSTLPKYSDPLIRQICLETRQLDSHIQSTTSSYTREELNSPENLGVVAGLTVHHLAARRNKRCLMAYLAGRVDGVKGMYWEAGGGVAHLLASDRGASSLDEGSNNNNNNGNNNSNSNGQAGPTTTTPHGDNTLDLRSRLSPHELDFLLSYNDLILSYKTPFLSTLDLSSSISSPPGELYVDVQVVKDCGVVWTEMGQVEFRKGSRYMVRRGDVERLIVQGFLVEV